MATAAFDPTQLGQATALISLVGFSIQQALQGLDTFVSAGITFLKSKRPNGALPGGLTDADFKKSVMVLLSFLLGLGTVVAVPQLRLLAYVDIGNSDLGTQFLDVLVSALVFGAGTEGANTVLKYFGYVKDARRKPVIELDIVPKAATLSKGSSLQFLVTAKEGADSRVAWQVLTGSGGSINSTGLYTAPTTTGTFQIAAVSAVDSSAVALSTVTVS